MVVLRSLTNVLSFFRTKKAFVRITPQQVDSTNNDALRAARNRSFKNDSNVKRATTDYIEEPLLSNDNIHQDSMQSGLTQNPSIHQCTKSQVAQAHAKQPEHREKLEMKPPLISSCHDYITITDTTGSWVSSASNIDISSASPRNGTNIIYREPHVMQNMYTIITLNLKGKLICIRKVFN